MTLKQGIQRHPFLAAAASAALASFLTWHLVNVNRVIPLREEEQKLRQTISAMEQQTDYRNVQKKNAETEKEKRTLYQESDQTAAQYSKSVESIRRLQAINDDNVAKLNAVTKNSDLLRKVEALEKKRDQMAREIDSMGQSEQQSEGGSAGLKLRQERMRQAQEQILSLQKKLSCQP
jgi:predicted nuclease with TOPRIM domain